MVDMIQAIQEILNTIRPAIVRDGGNIELVEFKEGVVYVRLLGACVQCPLSLITLKLGVEEQLKAQIPMVKQVVAVD